MPTRLQDLLRAFRDSYSSRRTGKPVSLSELVSSIYAEAMTGLDEPLSRQSYRNRYATRNPHPNKITSQADVAGELWCLFPSHFFKFHNTLVETALPGSSGDLVYSIFGCGRLTILDVCAGVGTAALATIDILHEWQRFLMRSGLAPSAIQVTVQPVETNPLKLSVLDRILHQAAERITPYLLRISIRPAITVPYPEEGCVAEIAASLAGGGTHLFVTLSNVLTWIRDWRPAPERFFARVWDRIVGGFRRPQLPLYLLETLALLNRLPFDVKTVALVETDDAGGRLARGVDEATRALAARLQDAAMNTSGPGRVILTNPRGSKWREQGRPVSPLISFHRGLCRALVPSFRRQQRLQEALSVETLFLAWAKARHWEHTMFVSDEVATKLFESDLAWKLERFRQIAYAGDIQEVYGSWVVPYSSPKGPDTDRPMSCCTLEDQMLLIALLWVQLDRFERAFDRCGVVSLGYRLNDQGDEFLYQHWFRCHRRLVRGVKQALEKWGGGFHQADITRFFDNLHHGKLRERLLAHLEEPERLCREVWEAHVLRRCWNGNGPERGVPQGHAVSGLLSNVYLSPFDEEMYTEQRFRQRYFRYVDDMVWVYPQGERPDRLPDWIPSYLSARHSLDFNTEKSGGGTTEDYLRKIVDPELHALAERTHALIRPVYRLGRREFASFQKNKHSFCAHYSELLRHLGVFVSPWHLLRKLRGTEALGDRLRRLLRLGTRFAFPRLPEQAGPAALTAWVQEFQTANQEWWEVRNRLTKELLLFCGGPLVSLEKATDPEQKRGMMRRVKFGAFRLGVLWHAEAPALFRLLLAKPWIVHPQIAARALRHYRAVEILREGLASRFPLVRAKCAQELGHFGDEGAKPALWNMAEHAEKAIERVASTEGLLRIGSYTEGDRMVLLRCIHHERHPYALKNLVLMLPLAGVAGWPEVAQAAVQRCPHQVVVDSLVWALNHPGENVLLLPDVEPPYTRKTRYPDFELYPLYFEASG